MLLFKTPVLMTWLTGKVEHKFVQLSTEAQNMFIYYSTSFDVEKGCENTWIKRNISMYPFPSLQLPSHIT